MNVIGWKTLVAKESRRFMKVPGQTILNPVINTALYFVVFGYALGGYLRELDGVPYIRFIIPGLIMQSIIQNSLLNTASSLFVSKLQGTIIDLLLAPLTAFEVVSAYVVAALARALSVAVLVWLVASAFTSFHVAHPLYALAFALGVGVVFALGGMVVAIASNNFEQLNLIPAFVITPLTFLGGVFYSPHALPRPWSTLTRANPILYMVDGLRYGLIGHSDTNPNLGLAIVVGTAVILGATVYAMLHSGYKLRT
jgi:ABC-2 type transport system permease protein